MRSWADSPPSPSTDPLDIPTYFIAGFTFCAVLVLLIAGMSVYDYAYNRGYEDSAVHYTGEIEKILAAERRMCKEEIKNLLLDRPPR